LILESKGGRRGGPKSTHHYDFKKKSSAKKKEELLNGVLSFFKVNHGFNCKNLLNRLKTTLKSI
jgi:hypothetical protein